MLSYDLMGEELKKKTFSDINEKVNKAKLTEKAINLIEKKGIAVDEAFQTCGLKKSPFSYPRIYRKYKEGGLEAIIDTRGGKRVEKVTPSIKDFIILQKSENKKLTAKQIRKKVWEEYDVQLHISSISNILKDSGLSTGKGRPKKEIEEVAIDHAGGFLLKGALICMGLVKVIVDRIRIRADEIEKNGDKSFKWMSVISASRKVLSRKIETLLYMPIFQMERIWHFKTVYPRDGLGVLSGSGLPYKYHTMDNFLRELPRLDIDKILSRDLARAYIEVFNLKFETKEEQTFYIDCHKKVLWTKKNVPKGLHATRNKILKCLDVYFIHDCNGMPILPWTRPGDSHLVNEIMPIIEELEKSVGKEIVKLVIFDREGVSLALFREFTERGKRFVTILKTNQYDSEDDFIFEKGSKWRYVTIKTAKGKKRFNIKEGIKILVEQESGKKYEVRVILAKDPGTGKMPVFITNIMKSEEPDCTKIVKKYIKRWFQENSFKQMKPGLYLDTNHGSNGVALKENRVIKRKVKKLEEEIRAKANAIISAESFIERRLDSIKRKKTTMNKKVLQLKNKLKNINAKILTEINVNERAYLLKRQEGMHLEESEFIKYYESVISKWQSDINRKQSYIDKKRNEIKDITNKLSKIDQKEILYEIDSRKDHMMTNFEVALNNADLFLKKNFFPPEYKNADFKTIRDILYKQDGFIKESKDEILVTLKHYRQEPEHQRLAEYVVKKINATEIITEEGKRLRMNVV